MALSDLRTLRGLASTAFLALGWAGVATPNGRPRRTHYVLAHNVDEAQVKFVRRAAPQRRREAYRFPSPASSVEDTANLARPQQDTGTFIGKSWTCCTTPLKTSDNAVEYDALGELCDGRGDDVGEAVADVVAVACPQPGLVAAPYDRDPAS